MTSGIREKRQEIEDALLTLREVLDDDDASEPAFQAWFEAHPIVFQALNYVDFRPHPELPLFDGDKYVPDFIVQRPNGLWVIFELKTPATRILKERDRRQTFYARLAEYIQQCLDYSKYFLDRQNRERFFSESSITIEGQPQAKLVAGRNNGLDRYKVAERLGDQGHWVELITYDDIHNQLELYKSNVLTECEQLVGLLIYFVVILPSLDRPGNLVTIGTDHAVNCASIYLDNEEALVFEVVDKAGMSHKSRVTKGEGGFDSSEFLYFMFEYGQGSDYAVTSIEVNGVYHSFNIIDACELELDMNAMVIGGDCNGENGGTFDIFEKAVWAHTLNLEDRASLRQYAYSLYLDPHTSKIPGFRFEGRQYMRRNSHPNFSPVPDSSPGDMVQPIPERQPRLLQSDA